MRTGGLGGVLLSIFVIALLLTSAALLTHSWNPLTSTSSKAQIWTEDAGGNIRTDFEPDETVYICGFGFSLNAQIEITITKPDNTVFQDSTLSDGNGNFIYPYLLDGIRGTYYVTATDGVNSASATFDDSPKLQGFDKTAGKWSSGSLTGWKELDWVPYRIRFKDLPKGTLSYTFNVYHNNLLYNKDGVDRVRDFHVGDENGNPVDGTVVAAGPFYKTPGKGCDRDIYYTLSVSFTTPTPGLTWYLYWQAHLAFGASKWPGASLHVYTDISGKQDVGINVPPVPTGSISGYKWGDSNNDGLWDPGENGLPGWTINLYHFDNIENIWVNLENKITDSAGRYTFSGLVAGSYRLCEVLKDNWTQTFPPSGCHEVALSEGEARFNINFGNLFMPFVRGVSVSISPDNQSGIPGENLIYTVIIRNDGNILDNYSLVVSDNENWDLTLSENSLAIAAGASENVTLIVEIPCTAFAGREDNITVTVYGTGVENSATVITSVGILRGVDVSISPSYQENLPGENLVYIVTVTNTGNVADNYDLSVSYPEGWQVTFLFNFIDLPPYSSAQSELTVIIPKNAIPGTSENITVTAVSQSDNMITDSDSCIAQVKIVRGVEVSIFPENPIGPPGENITCIITVTNTGNVDENYALTVSDNENWGPTLSENLLTVPAGSGNTAALSVVIPSNAYGGAQDNITITATSTENTEVSVSVSCIAQAAVFRAVRVSISPSSIKALQGATLPYTVTVSNEGNVDDNYNLTVSDTKGWGPSLPEYLAVPAFENRTTTLNVTIPGDAAPGTVDNITVTATSQENAQVSDSVSCIAQRADPKLDFVTKYKVNVEMDLYLHTGSKLIVKFYTYENVYENEDVVWEGSTPAYVSLFENVPHPDNVPVKIAKIIVAGAENQEILSVTSLFVTKSHLVRRVSEIKSRWPYALPEEKSELVAEISNIKARWPFMPYY